jgi:hypothetical protein
MDEIITDVPIFSVEIFYNQPPQLKQFISLQDSVMSARIQCPRVGIVKTTPRKYFHANQYPGDPVLLCSVKIDICEFRSNG